MATGSCDIPRHHYPYAIVWSYPASGSTAPFQISPIDEELVSIFNSGVENLSEVDKDWKLQATTQNQNKRFIKLHNSFDKQYAQLVQHYINVGEPKLRAGLSEASSNLFDLSPDVLSLQLTYDQSIFFTFIKGNKSIYLELFFDAEAEGTDETVVTVFEGDNNILSYAGSLDESIEFMRNIFSPSEVAETVSLEYALS